MMIPKVGPSVAWQIVEDEAIIVDLATGKTIGLNPTGTLLWSNIDGQRDAGALAAALAGRFAVSPETAQSDTEEFLTEMTRRALIVDAEDAR